MKYLENNLKFSKLKFLLFLQEEVEKTSRKNYKDRKDLCFFCEKDVSHFARHMYTWHRSETDIQRILSYKNNSKEKKEALSALRKKGNFIRNRTNVKLRPVKRVHTFGEPVAADFLPCSHCLGFYKRKSLYRHTKRCSENKELSKNQRQNSQSDGQTALLLGTFIKHDELLKKELFPRMRADSITLVAKKDPIICNYGYSYLKGRRRKGNLDVVRQNMRRLAKLLTFARSENSEIKELIDLLRPSLFQTIIRGVNKIACYNSETETYESPTVAMNFGTLIKKCCDLAYIQLLQKPNTSDQRKDLKILKVLIESQWADEVSAQAASNLNEKKWNKEELIPLTSDLKKLDKFLQDTAEEMFNKLLLHKTNFLFYNTLKEVLYTQIILLNRRRPAEVAQLKVQTYMSVDLDSKENNEFESCLTETERMLLRSYSRIVIRGKRGKGVPILLSENMRKYFDCIVELRKNFIDDNDFIFHTSGKNFIDGTKILHKYAEKCGVQYPERITSIKLRKHLATVTQLLQFTEKDLEQLSKFMGHTLNIHCNVYRLSDNMYQTAKVSKLLLLAKQGGVGQYKGMRLDDIDINMDPIYEDNIAENESVSEIIERINDSNTPQIENCPEGVENSSQNLPNIRNDKFVRRIPWTKDQKKIISTYFANHIKNKQAPKKHEIEEFIIEHPDFENRNWATIKAVVFNIYSGKLRN